MLRANLLLCLTLAASVAPSAAWAQCPYPKHYEGSATVLFPPPAPPNTTPRIGITLFGPLGNPGGTPPAQALYLQVDYPGGFVTFDECNGGPEGQYVFSAATEPAFLAGSAKGGSASCSAAGVCSGDFALVLPPIWVEEPIRGIPVGCPVDVVTGNVWLDQTDADLTGARRRLRFTRSYNSALSRSAPGSNRGPLGHEFGPGWTHSYEQEIAAPDPDPSRSAMSLSLRLGNGDVFYYTEDPLTPGTYRALIPMTETTWIESTPTSYVRRFRDGASETYDKASGRLTEIADALGPTTTLSYDSQGRLVTIKDGPAGGEGRSLKLGYEGTSPLARDLKYATVAGDVLIATYTYSSSNSGYHLGSVTYADGDGYQGNDGSYAFGYDAAHYDLLSLVTDGAGKIVESHTYDGSGRGLTSEVGGANGAGVERLTLEYNSGQGGLHGFDGARTRVDDGRGNVTIYDYRQAGGVPRIAEVIGGCSSCGGGGQEHQKWTYDEKGHVASHTDGAGNVTSYTYYANGDLETETRKPDRNAPETHVVRYTYYPDAAPNLGRINTRTDPNGAVTAYTYELAGPTSITETVTASQIRVTGISYLDGKPHNITDPRGKIWELNYATNGDLQWIKDPLLHQTSFEYDAMGRLRKTIPPAVAPPAIAPRETTYDFLGHVTLITNTDDSSFTRFIYDGGGRRTDIIDARGTQTHFDYDSYGRLWQVHNIRTQLPNLPDYVTEYGYDSMSNLRTITDARLKTTTFDYDAFNRVEKITYPATSRPPFEQFTYYATGQVATRLDRKGVTTTFSYDGLGRLTQKVFSDGSPAVSFTYDQGVGYEGAGQKGRMTSASNANVALTWTYDLAGQMRSEAATRATGPASTVGWGYDLAGNRSTVSLGSDTIEYTYDDRGLPEIVRWLTQPPKEFHYQYDEASRRRHLTFPTTTPLTTTQWGYDARSRLSSILTTHGLQSITNLTYPSYDAMDNRLQRGGTTAPAQTYHYDDVYRLDSLTGGSSETYTYDPVGNRLSSIPFPAPPWSYGDRNELLGFGGDIQLTYDRNGNLTSKTETAPADAWTYQWDVENRLTRVTHNGVQVATYDYDPLGRRNQRTLPSVRYTYVYDGEDIFFQDFSNLIMEENILDPPPHLYIHGPGTDEPLAVRHGNGTVWYYHADALGSIVTATDSAGISVQPRAYDSFGNMTDGADQEGYAFTGREWNPESGLYYYRARYYDPKIGRLISEDPIRFAGGNNFYAYVENDPVNRTDPLGLKACCGGSGSGSFWLCQEKCVYEHLINPALWVGGITLGATAVTWSNAPGPGPNGAPWSQFLGATAATTVALRLGLAKTVPALIPWMQAGAVAGAGATTVAGAVVSGAAIYSVGVLGGCWLACGIDPCAF